MVNWNKENEEQNKEKYSEQPVIAAIQAIIAKKATSLEEEVTLNSACEAWMKRAKELKWTIIKNPCELMYPERCEIADEDNFNNLEAPKENKDQLIRLPQDLKSEPQELNVRNSLRTEEELCTSGLKIRREHG
ncbi:21622_t:CDS:2 [Gigaspora margarita]|uniref:21622_t:CDS:1 n=1 Tax=Gigaspora margarita TaxID=4874 RepID=A0ABN7W491_GIGMA|nr:21622_t:CDS:2 [Gigaspora margarita]